MMGHTDDISHIMGSSDGSVVMTDSSIEQAFWLWDTDTWKAIASFKSEYEVSIFSENLLHVAIKISKSL